jgi:hypothetical protein
LIKGNSTYIAVAVAVAAVAAAAAAAAAAVAAATAAAAAAAAASAMIVCTRCSDLIAAGSQAIEVGRTAGGWRRIGHSINIRVAW